MGLELKKVAIPKPRKAGTVTRDIAQTMLRMNIGTAFEIPTSSQRTLVQVLAIGIGEATGKKFTIRKMDGTLMAIRTH